MLNVGGGELIVIALIALIALGPEQLPTVMRKLGALSAQLRSVTTGLKDEFLSGLDQPAPPPRTTFDPDQPVVPRGYAEQRRAEGAAAAAEGDGGTGAGPADGGATRSSDDAGRLDGGSSATGTSATGTSATGGSAIAGDGQTPAEAHAAPDPDGSR